MRTRPDECYRQSAVIPYRLRSGGIEILLVTSRQGKRWVVPKGIRDPAMSAAESAAQEALEEAGIRGRLSSQPAGSYSYRKWGGTCRVEVFTMLVEVVLEVWPEDHRDREWLAPEAAARRVREPELQRLLRATAHRLHRSDG